mgnify:CR=1 FL=1
MIPTLDGEPLRAVGGGARATRATKKTATKKSATSKPSSKKPSSKEPSSKKSATKKTATRKSATKKSASSKKAPPRARTHAYRDGRPVPTARESDVVYVALDGDVPWFDLPLVDEQHTGALVPIATDAPTSVQVGDEVFTSDDVAALLGAIPGPRLSSPAAVDAGFFHTTLLAWLGEGQRPSKVVAWPYGFWAASVDEVSMPAGALLGAPRAARAYEARIFRGDTSEPETFRYWLVVDDKGAISRGGFVGDAPDLLAVDDAVFDEPRAVSADELFRALDEA